MKEVKYPHVHVQLVGLDGNAFYILGRCRKAMRDADCTKEQIDEFVGKAMEGDYDHLLRTCMDYFEIN